MIPPDEPPSPPEAPIQFDGPYSYANWTALASGLESGGAQEYPIFSDAYLVGELTLGPYEIINTAAGDDHNAEFPAAFLRASFVHFDMPDMSATDDEGYHGGTFENEIAALLALAFGCRAYAGTSTRWFQRGGDPRGRPWGSRHDVSARPVLIRRNPYNYVVPIVKGERRLEPIDILTGFVSLRPRDAIAVVRVARLYQDAVWLAEAQPELAWLLMVSAVEAAAQHWSAIDDDPVERLRLWRPELHDRLASSCDPSLLSAVADQVVGVTGATSKFVRFLLSMAPSPPDQRPPEWARIPWTSTARRTMFSRIYEYRSRALHGGTPFPAPMGWAPRMNEGGWSERPEGGASAVGYWVWRSEDTPMYLNTFAYIARQALLNWWRAMLPPSGAPSGGAP